MRNLRVLIVDDESRIAQLISKLIHWKENGLIPAGIYLDGQQAYEQISSGNADIVITDIRMPVMDGLELIRRSHELHQNSVHFIVISGYREFEYAHTALKYGVEDYLLKPVNENELNATLKRLSTRANALYHLQHSSQVIVITPYRLSVFCEEKNQICRSSLGRS